jgi:carbamoylphosphate synthase large subunit
MITLSSSVLSKTWTQWAYWDSITVAAMTLSDTTFQKVRDMAVLMMRSIETSQEVCNVQFAVSPDEKKIS